MVLKLPGIMMLLLDESRSGEREIKEIASTVVAAASQFQRKASNVRLAINPSLNRAMAVNEERKKKAALNEIKDAVRIVASLWEISSTAQLGPNSKMIIARCFAFIASVEVVVSQLSAQLPNIRITTRCHPSQRISEVLDNLLSQVRVEFAKCNPFAEVLDWFVPFIYAQLHD
jgi:hypothetical protein